MDLISLSRFNYESMIYRLITDKKVYYALKRLINNIHSEKDLDKVCEHINANNGNIFVKHDYVFDKKDFDFRNALFKSPLTQIYISVKDPTVVLKKKYFLNSNSFVGEVIIGQYLNYFAPDFVQGCVQYIDKNRYIISYSKCIDGIEWSNSNFKLSEKTLTVINNLCRAVMEIHKLHVVHNDLKLENILVDEKTLDVKIIDFESSSFEDIYNINNAGTIVYMCPLLLSSKFKIRRSKFTDLYSLIVCIFYIISECGILFDDKLSCSDIMRMTDREIYDLHENRIKTIKIQLGHKVSTAFLDHIVKMMNIDVFLNNDKHMSSDEYLTTLMNMINTDNIYIYKKCRICI